MSKNGLTSRYFYAIISKFVTTSAAIAQPVERILGKDEVASSNLASSSKKEPRPSGLGSFFAAPDLNHLNAARTSAAAEGSTEANLNFCHSHAGAKMQPNLAGSLIDALKYSHPQTGGRYFFSQTSLLMLIRYRSFL